MENVVLVIHLLLALALIAVVLLQRSEGGGLGIGGGGGGAATGRPPLSGLGKLTWGFAIAFICTSIFLTVLAAQNAGGTSVLDRLGGDGSAQQPAPTGTSGGTSGGTGGLDLPLPPPPTLGDAPLTPPRAE